MKTKSFLTSLLLIFPCLMLKAQTWGPEPDPVRDNRPARLGKTETIDTSVMECVYEHMIYDPSLKKTRLTDYILEIGKNASRYSVYGTYQRDSIIKTDYPDGLTYGEYTILSQKYGASLNQIIRYKNTGKLSYYERLFAERYVYEEPIPDIDWTLVNDKDEICGHECLKATCSFRGRDWTAWYCPEIEIDGGPWKFGGLPGLILKVEDSEKEHIFEAFQVRKSNNKISYSVSSDIFQTDRKAFNKMLADFYENPGAFLEGNPLMPTTVDGKPAIKKGKRRFFNPIEKE